MSIKQRIQHRLALVEVWLAKRRLKKACKRFSAAKRELDAACEHRAAKSTIRGEYE